MYHPVVVVRLHHRVHQNYHTSPWGLVQVPVPVPVQAPAPAPVPAPAPAPAPVPVLLQVLAQAEKIKNIFKTAVKTNYLKLFSPKETVQLRDTWPMTRKTLACFLPYAQKKHPSKHMFQVCFCFNLLFHTVSLLFPALLRKTKDS